MSDGADMIHILPVALLLLATPASGFVCVNGFPTVAAEYGRRMVFIGTAVSERYERATKDWDQDGTTYAVRVDERLHGQLPRGFTSSARTAAEVSRWKSEPSTCCSFTAIAAGRWSTTAATLRFTASRPQDCGRFEG